MQIDAASTVWNLLEGQAARTPEAPAISTPSRPDLSYQGLLDQTRAARKRLNDGGFGCESRLALVLPSGPEGPCALVAVLSACVAVPLNPAYSHAEFTASFRNCRVDALITRPNAVPEAARAAADLGITVIVLEVLEDAEAGRFRLHLDQIGPPASSRHPAANDLAAVFSTSGTTSQPKLIPVTQSVVCYRATLARRFIDLSAADRCLDLLPSFHGDAVLVSILGSFLSGATSIYVPTPATADFARTVAELKPTWCALPPPFVEKLISERTGWESDEPPSQLRAFFTCGAPVSAATVEGIERVFQVPLQNSYGASECGGVAANPMPPGLRKRGSVGVSIGPELAVLNDTGGQVATGETGEVAVRGPGVFGGYENAAESRGAAFTGEWYRTGDRGYLDAEGYLFLTGRLGEAINRGGEKILPEEVEAVLCLHPLIARAAVFPIPHEGLGQDIAALVVPHADVPTLQSIREFAEARLAGFKIPRVILVVPEIPTGAAGKVVRNQLASSFAEELSAAALGRRADHREPRNPVENGLARIWRKHLQTEQVGIADRFLDLGGDSLLAVNMLSEVERSFGRSIPMGPFWQDPTIENLARLVMAADLRKSSVVLPVQTVGSRPPLFFVQPGWFVADVELLCRYLGPDQPVYALIPDTRPGAGQSGMSCDEIVAECTAGIRGIQKASPYFVIGRSVGGIVALEIAHQLRAQGETTALVGMLDTHYPGVTRQKLLPAPLRTLEFLLGELVALPRSQWGPHLRALPGRAVRLAWRQLCGKRLPVQQANRALYTGLERVFHNAPERWPGRLVLFAAESSRHRGFLDRRLYWSRAAEHGLEVHLVPGDHNMMVQEPNISTFATTLKGCIARASQQYS